ncbi:B34 [miniopterid betaherpesvirus 1]|uniref:B34 n=1 Tax=miniopterid betaherpesvirus 1 TaxID=3070189 RepID=I3VQ09_9BETA|nr:B34 [miniopterid betaherpesvirus 1]AFK83853.1 B34 [miniopterid betaherpesvirus 1]
MAHRYNERLSDTPQTDRDVTENTGIPDPYWQHNRMPYGGMPMPAYFSGLERERNFVRSVSMRYKGSHRAEDRKNFLSLQLPIAVKAKSATASYLFCTQGDCENINANIFGLRRGSEDILSNLDYIDKTIRAVKCRLRRKPDLGSKDKDKIPLLETIRDVSVSFNRLSYVARLRHYCKGDSKLKTYLRYQLSKRCDINSRLNLGIHKLIKHTDVNRYNACCIILSGVTCQTPHMWSRSIRLLARLKVFLQINFLKMIADTNVNLSDVFESPYHNLVHKLANQLKQQDDAIFKINPQAPQHIYSVKNSRNETVLQKKEAAAAARREAAKRRREKKKAVAALAKEAQALQIAETIRTVSLNLQCDAERALREHDDLTCVGNELEIGPICDEDQDPPLTFSPARSSDFGSDHVSPSSCSDSEPETMGREPTFRDYAMQPLILTIETG